MCDITIVTAACLALAAGVGAWATSTTQARVATPTADSVDPMQIMTSAKNLPTEELVDYTFVFN
jgi:hypothetical protein